MAKRALLFPTGFPLTKMGNAQMVQTAITDAALKRINPAPGTRIELWDAYVEGFGYRATLKGKGSFFVMYRLEQRQHRFTIGRYPVMTLEEARSAATEALKLARSGVDPAARRAQEIDAARARQARTVASAVEDFIKLYPRYRPSTRAEVGRLLNKELVPLLGELAISAVGRKDIARVVNAVSDRGAGTTANRLFSYMQALFGWLVDRGELETTPIVNLSKPSPERSRDRVLSDAELAAVWKAAETMAYPFGSIVQLLMLTGQRRDEVAGMRREDIDLAAKLWTLPRELTKSDRQHEVPLSPLALDILKGLPARDKTLIFPVQRHRKPAAEPPAEADAEKAPRHVSGWSACKRRLDQRAAEALGAPFPPWTLHDIRRSVASGMAAMGIPPHVVERLLNHSSGTIRGVGAVYNRHSYRPEVTHAIDAWSAHIAGLVGGPVVAKVATLSEHRQKRAAQ